VSDLNEQIQETRSQANSRYIVRQTIRSKEKQQIDSLTDDVITILHAICMDIAKNPDVYVTERDTPGFSVSLIDAIDPAHVPFTVSAKFPAPDQVELQASDGKWDAASNVHGAWGEWSDEKILYSGPLDESNIRRAVSAAFLHWYQHAQA
jgi:hypothetical protein